MKNQEKNLCVNCPNPCCQAVKRLPYLGEKDPIIFEYLLIGSFPDPNLLLNKNIRFRRPFIVEWTLPIEVSKCPAYTKDKLCKIYKHRPLTCKMFPRTHTGEIHPFCPFGEAVCTVPKWQEPEFTKKLAKLDSFLMNKLFLEKDGRKILSNILHEEESFKVPALYNNYLILVLLLSGANIKQCLTNQYKAIKNLISLGLDEVNFYIPDSDEIMPANLSGLKTNLDYLFYIIEEEKLLTIFSELLSVIFC